MNPSTPRPLRGRFAQDARVLFSVLALVAAGIRRRIIAGELQPGDRLPSEAEMMRSYEIARPTLREALRLLEAALDEKSLDDRVLMLLANIKLKKGDTAAAVEEMHRAGVEIVRSAGVPPALAGRLDRRP